MKKILFLLCCVFTTNLFSQDLVVQTFSDAHHTGANTIMETFNFPDDVANYHKIEMRISLTCPTGGCDPWDRIAWLQLHKDDEVYEIGRYATPYGNGWCSWTIDVTDYRLLLSGDVTLSSYIETWENGWLLNVDFEFYEGVPEYEHIRIENVWAGDESHPSMANNNNYYNFLYGEPFFTYDLPSKTVGIPTNREKTIVRIVNTGHGQANTDNAAEFSEKTHQLKINNEIVGYHHLWNSDCNQNPCSPQAGTWQYPRAGWCPGQEVSPHDIDITSNTYIWQDLELDYVLESYTNACTPWNMNCEDGITCTECSFNGSSHTQPNYKIAIQILHFSNSEMKIKSLEKAVDVYPNPATDVVHIRFDTADETYSIKCFNIQGDLVFTEKSENNQSMSISTKELDRGIYTLSFVSDKNNFTYKLILTH